VASPRARPGRGIGPVAGRRVYGLLYESATTPGEAFSDMLTVNRHEEELRFR
jgi:hypothetical protein